MLTIYFPSVKKGVSSTSSIHFTAQIPLSDIRSGKKLPADVLQKLKQYCSITTIQELVLIKKKNLLDHIDNPKDLEKILALKSELEKKEKEYPSKVFFFVRKFFTSTSKNYR